MKPGGCKQFVGYLLVISVAVVVESTSEPETDLCKFKREWRGTWFQHLAGEVTIRGKSIDGKGRCVASRGDFYLLHERSENCYACLLLMGRHDNILQYRETYCLHQPPLRADMLLERICADITQESPLFTLVKESPTSVPCPIDKAYYFDYNDDVSGYCNNRLSYVKPCSGGTTLSIHFEHCKSSALYHMQDLELRCLATWKEGSERYLYASLHGPGISKTEDSYRCFKYEHYGSDLMYIGMSYDATCRGLFTAKRAPFMMALRKDVNLWPTPSCRFPIWLAGIAWRDLHGQRLYNLSTNGQMLLTQTTGKSGISTETELSCIESVLDNPSEKSFVVFRTAQCSSTYGCLTIRHITDSILEIYYVSTRVKEPLKCFSPEPSWDRKVLAIATENVRACPSLGTYTPTIVNERCNSATMMIGCPTPSAIRYMPGCWEDQGFGIDCRESFIINGTNYVLASAPRSTLLGCLNIDMTRDKLLLTFNPDCIFKSQSVQRPETKLFKVKTNPDPCNTNQDFNIFSWPDLPRPIQVDVPKTPTAGVTTPRVPLPPSSTPSTTTTVHHIQYKDHLSDSSAAGVDDDEDYEDDTDDDPPVHQFEVVQRPSKTFGWTAENTVVHFNVINDKTEYEHQNRNGPVHIDAQQGVNMLNTGVNSRLGSRGACSRSLVGVALLAVVIHVILVI